MIFNQSLPAQGGTANTCTVTIGSGQAFPTDGSDSCVVPSDYSDHEPSRAFMVISQPFVYDQEAPNAFCIFVFVFAPSNDVPQLVRATYTYAYGPSSTLLYDWYFTHEDFANETSFEVMPFDNSYNDNGSTLADYEGYVFNDCTIIEF